jgi:hypothetical protein
MIAKTVGWILTVLLGTAMVSTIVPVFLACMAAAYVAVYVIGWEYLVTFWHMPWRQLSLTAWVIVIAATLIATASIQRFRRMALENNEGSGLRIVVRVILAPIIFFGVAFVVQYLQIIERPLTIGTFLGDLFSIIYFAAVFGLGVVKAISILALDGDNIACRAAMMYASTLGPDGLLAQAPKLPEQLLAFLRLPATHPHLYEAVFGPTLEREWYDLRWQGSTSIPRYLTMGMHLTSCSLRGAFPEGFSQAAGWVYSKLLSLLQ